MSSCSSYKLLSIDAGLTSRRISETARAPGILAGDIRTIVSNIVRIISLPCFFTWASQCGLWLIFADNAGFREMLIGAAGAAVSTFFVALFLRCSPQRFELQARCWAQAIYIPQILFHDTWILLRAVARRVLGRNVHGQIVSVPFDVGGNDAISRGRRALAITFLNLTPNSLVLGILKKENILFFHTVIPQPLPPFMEKMGARSGRSQ